MKKLYSVRFDFSQKRFFDKIKIKKVLRINLQLFAGEKTEKATPRKRSQARQKGQVLKSKEMESAIVLLAIFLAIKIFGRDIYRRIELFFVRVFDVYAKNENLFTIKEIIKLMEEIIILFVQTAGIIIIIAVAIGLFMNYSQVGVLFTTETISFKFSRINPFNGIKNLFSMRGLVDLVKSIFKIVIVLYISYKYIMDQSKDIIRLMQMDVFDVARFTVTTAIDLAIRICIALIILGILDFRYQKWQFEKDLKMSKEEVKEEHKQIEGNPEVKGKIKQKQRQISMKRMLQEVPTADVIITNPTHFAVAIKYDTSLNDAPIVVAKGQDFIAKRIKEVGKENNIEIVENKVLARQLYEMTEVGKTIPNELYQAVAEVLAFVYSLKK